MGKISDQYDKNVIELNIKSKNLRKNKLNTGIYSVKKLNQTIYIELYLYILIFD